MNFAEYEEKAVSTAIYPGQGGPLGLMYVALKMNGEAGEFAEHVGKAIRDDGLVTDPGQLGKVIRGNGLTEERQQSMVKEVGDVLWYLAAAARELGTSLSDIAEANIAKLAKRKAEGKLGGSGDDR